MEYSDRHGSEDDPWPTCDDPSLVIYDMFEKSRSCMLVLLKAFNYCLRIRVIGNLIKHSANNLLVSGQWCGSVGRAVASDTRDPRFKSRQRQTFIERLFTVNCVEKTKIKKKKPGMAHF